MSVETGVETRAGTEKLEITQYTRAEATELEVMPGE